MNHVSDFFKGAAQVCERIDYGAIERMAHSLSAIREQGGRLFILGVGGSAGNASHAVNDFRKLCGIESYAPTDNVAELTARTNDDGWETVFAGWLKTSRINDKDGVLVFSVGGGNIEYGISMNLVHGLKTAKECGAHVFGVVGRDGGYTATVADVVVIVPMINPTWVTPYTEAFQAMVWHCLVSHPALQNQQTKW
ncbi:MAG: SIS domain-containing protein [Synechococcaceae cyanobacterium SM1_2_3]|nr:SIS domain-containing protein [Synechococcaceae cyanobacterium SM1_2_3]